ncbi:MAG: hypothetical protein Q8L20_03010, partial [Gammaproteobacteria bacterium]|nr:hypothetical protein [Gammaproteobacteria bacterium]
MSDSTLQKLLQEVAIIATGRAANASELAWLESLIENQNYGPMVQLVNEYMGGLAAASGTAATIKAAAMNGLGIVLSDDDANSLANALTSGQLSWAEAFVAVMDRTDSVGQILNNRAEAAYEFLADLALTGKSDFFNGQAINIAVKNLLQNIGSSQSSLNTGFAGFDALVANLSANGINSAVVDGYVKGATVFIDANGNGKLDDGEWSATTDDNGNYTLPPDAASGKIIASGGIDIMTNQPFLGVLTAPSGSTVVNPLTTILQALVDSGQADSIEAASAKMQSALGLPASVNLLTYDPLAVLGDTAASQAAKDAALAIQKTALQLANVLTQAGAAINASKGADDLAGAGDAVAKALAAAIGGSSGALSLTSVSTLTDLIEDAALRAGAANLVGQGGQIAQVTGASNTAAADASNITNLAKVAVVAQGSATNALATGATGGNNFDNAINGFTGTALTDAVTSAVPGTVPGGTTTPPPGGGGGSTPTTFTVSVNLDTGTVTFGGTATGNISVAITTGVATFTRGGINASTTVTDLEDKIINLAAGQTLVIEAEDADALDGIEITGDGNVTLTGLSLAQYDGIDVSVAGTVTITLADSATNLSDSNVSYASESINVTVTDAASVSTLGTINSLWGTVTPTTIDDTLSAIESTGTDYQGTAVNLIIGSSTVSIAKLNELDELWGTVRSMYVEDAAANLDEASDSNFEGTDYNVSVTGGATLAQLHAIDELWGTVTASTIVDSAANFLANTNSDFAITTIDATVTTAATITQLTTIDAVWGTVTPTAVADTASNLVSASSGDYIGSTVNATVSGAATIAQLTAIDSAWGTVSFNSIDDTATNLVAASASAYIGTAVNVTVSGGASIAQLETIDSVWGTVTPTTVVDTATNLASDTAYDSTDINVTVSGVASLAQLAQIDDLWGTVTYTAIADTILNLLDNDDGYVTGSVNVTVTNSATLAQLASVDALTSGTITATTVSGTAAALAASAYVTGSVAVTVDAGAVAAADLVTIKENTSGSINASAVSSISGSSVDVLAVYNADVFTGLGNETVTVTGSTAAAVIESILTKTTGAVTAGLANSYTTGSSLTVAPGDVINIDPSNTIAALNVNPEASAGDVDAAGEWHFNAGTGVFTWRDSGNNTTDSITLTGITAVEVGSDTITMPAAELSVVFTSGNTWTISGGTGNITMVLADGNLTFNAGGDDVVVTAADVGVLVIPSGRALVSLGVTLNTFTQLVGNVVNTTTAVGAIVLNSIDAKTTGTVTAQLTTLTGTVADVKTAVQSSGINILATDFNVNLTGVAVATDITAIRAETTGTLNGNGVMSPALAAISAINGTAPQVLQALADLDVDPANFNSTITGSAILSDLFTIGAAVGDGDLDISGITALVVTESADISEAADGESLGAIPLDMTAAAAITLEMTVAQHNGFSSITGSGGNDTIVLSDAGTISTAASIGTYSVVAGSNVTLGTAAGHLAQVIEETGAGVTTFTLGSGTYTGDWTGIDTNDVVRVVNGTNIAGNTGLNGGVVIDFQNANGVAISLNGTQNGVVTFSNTTNSQTVNVTEADTFTAAAGIETYGIVGASNITVLAATNVNGEDATNQTVTVGGLTVTGTYALGTGTDVIVATNGANIAGVNSGAVTTAETLTLTGGITMTRDQHQGFSSIAAAGGADSITLTTAGTVTAASSVETYNIVGASNITVAAATNVNGADGSDQTVTVGGLTVTGTYALGTGTDVIVATTGANIAGVNSGEVTTAETLTLTGGITMTRNQHQGFSAITAAGGA